jgi:hypothetical protein
MNKKKNVLLLLLLLLLAGCSDKNPHKGLYNALFVDYGKRVSKLDQNLTNIKISERKKKEQYQLLDQNVTEKELILNLHKEIDEVSLELDTLDIGEKDITKLNKIKKIIERMKQATIKNYH